MKEMLQIALKITLVIFMVGNLLDMGLRLRLTEAAWALRDLRFVILSLLWGFVVLPGLGYAMTEVIPMEHYYAIGLILLAMTPCAPFLPPMVDRAKGDLEYAAAFMVLMSVVTVAYMPLAVPLLVKGLSANPLTIAKPLVVFLLVPLLIGMALHYYSAPLAVKLHPIVKKVTGIDVLILMLIVAIIYGKEFLELFGSYAIGAQILFFALAGIAPYLLSFGMPREQKTVLSLGMTTRNLGASFAPLLAVPNADQRAMVMVALGVIMQTISSITAATYYGRVASRAVQDRKAA